MMQDDGCVLRRFRKRTDVVERRSEGNQSVARDPAIGRHQSNNAAECGWLTNGTTGIGSESGDRGTRSYARRRAATGATRNSAEVSGITDRAPGRILI